jgi:hypothetical protein
MIASARVGLLSSSAVLIPPPAFLHLVQRHGEVLEK